MERIQTEGRKRSGPIGGEIGKRVKGKKTVMSEEKKSVHKSVLLNETIDGLNLSGTTSVVLDATYGGGGHSREILRRFPKVRIIALDQDASVWKKDEKQISFHNENFRNIDKVLEKEAVKEVDGIIIDLGLSSDQFESSERGFSFMRDEPLIMTMKENPSSEDVTAYDVVNVWSEESLAKIIAGYGEEKFAKKIARGIVESRKEEPIKTTFDLVEVIKQSVPSMYRRGKIHFATRTFQAIRIAVNDELGALTDALPKAFSALRIGGRMSVISFHSLEDRIVKRFYREKENEGVAKLMTKRPITASEGELKENWRARSAKLRVIEKIK